MKRRFRFPRWSLVPIGGEPDVPVTAFTLRCLWVDDDGRACGAGSGPREDSDAAKRWAWGHGETCREHVRFSGRITRPWTMRIDGPL
ncbi:hypothetical protein CP967_06355 [Streptomyces nitrosporeus]|uniref:DUF7848 domain-containing protein n=1 Tax=Streptomyces nitrosporeus TaxID=28894 RepID=A0A5J6F5R0_9ACTN|nr:hypothetical protein CP967_06355 [Streptomyces nitrosporeus]GGZ27421.1 hypothetical protein GCM10010327_67340 [Streptomyces nitrosporeus]